MLVRSVAVWAVLAAVAWLDSDGSALAVRPTIPIYASAVFAAIVTGIQILAGWLAAGAEITVTYLATVVSWIGGRLAQLITSSGAMFAKVWDGIKIVWADVLKPTLVWIDDQLKRLQAWLKDTLKPAFDFLDRVRAELLDVYKRFVQPIIDTIEFLRALNRVLLAFHIKLLQQLDAVLQTIEQRIEEPFLWINAELNKIRNALDLVMTADGFFQRLTLIRSMSRYAPSWMRIATNARSKPLSADAAYAVQAHAKPQDSDELVDQMVAYLNGEQNDTGDAIDAAVQRALDRLNAA